MPCSHPRWASFSVGSFIRGACLPPHVSSANLEALRMGLLKQLHAKECFLLAHVHIGSNLGAASTDEVAITGLVPVELHFAEGGRCALCLLLSKGRQR
jgi:hypothetical protein